MIKMRKELKRVEAFEEKYEDVKDKLEHATHDLKKARCTQPPQSNGKGQTVNTHTHTQINTQLKKPGNSNQGHHVTKAALSTDSLNALLHPQAQQRKRTLEHQLDENWKARKVLQKEFASAVKHLQDFHKKELEKERQKRKCAEDQLWTKEKALVKWHFWWVAVKRQARKPTLAWLSRVRPNLTGAGQVQ